MSMWFPIVLTILYFLDDIFLAWKDNKKPISNLVRILHWLAWLIVIIVWLLYFLFIVLDNK